MTRSAAFLLGVRALLPMLLVTLPFKTGLFAAALAGLAAGRFDIGQGKPRFWAGLVAIAVAPRWKNTLTTIVSGFAALWSLNRLF